MQMETELSCGCIGMFLGPELTDFQVCRIYKEDVVSLSLSMRNGI